MDDLVQIIKKLVEENKGNLDLLRELTKFLTHISDDEKNSVMMLAAMNDLFERRMDKQKQNESVSTNNSIFNNIEVENTVESTNDYNKKTVTDRELSQVINVDWHGNIYIQNKSAHDKKSTDVCYLDNRYLKYHVDRIDYKLYPKVVMKGNLIFISYVPNEFVDTNKLREHSVLDARQSWEISNCIQLIMFDEHLNYMPYINLDENTELICDNGKSLFKNLIYYNNGGKISLCNYPKVQLKLEKQNQILEKDVEFANILYDLIMKEKNKNENEDSCVIIKPKNDNLSISEMIKVIQNFSYEKHNVSYSYTDMITEANVLNIFIHNNKLNLYNPMVIDFTTNELCTKINLQRLAQYTHFLSNRRYESISDEHSRNILNRINELSLKCYGEVPKITNTSVSKKK